MISSSSRIEAFARFTVQRMRRILHQTHNSRASTCLLLLPSSDQVSPPYRMTEKTSTCKPLFGINSDALTLPYFLQLGHGSSGDLNMSTFVRGISSEQPPWF